MRQITASVLFRWQNRCYWLSLVSLIGDDDICDDDVDDHNDNELMGVPILIEYRGDLLRSVRFIMV